MQDEGNNEYLRYGTTQRSSRFADNNENHRNYEYKIYFPDQINGYGPHQHNFHRSGHYNHFSGSSEIADLKNGQRKLAEDVKNVKNSLIWVQDSNLQSIHQKVEDYKIFLNDEVLGIKNDVDDQKKRYVMLEVNQNNSDSKLADLKFKLDAEINVQNNKSHELEANLKKLKGVVDQMNKTCQCEENQINLVKEVNDLNDKIFEMKSSHDKLEANQNRLNEDMFNIKNSLEKELVALKNKLDKELVDLKNKVNNKLNDEIIRLTNKDTLLESFYLLLQGKIRDLNDVVINLKHFQDSQVVNNSNKELESILIV